MLQENKKKYKKMMLIIPLILLPLSIILGMTIFDTDFNTIEKIITGLMSIIGLFYGIFYPIYYFDLYTRVNSIEKNDIVALEKYASINTQHRINIDKIANKYGDKIWAYLYDYLSEIKSEVMTLLEGKKAIERNQIIKKPREFNQTIDAEMQKEIDEAEYIKKIINKYYGSNKKWKKDKTQDKFSIIYGNVMIIIYYIVIIAIFVSLMVLLSEDIILIIGIIFVIAMYSFLIFYIFSNKNRKKKISKKDYKLIRDYTNNNKILDTLESYKIDNKNDFYTIYDEFEKLDSTRRSFLSGEPQLYITKEELKDNKSLYIIRKTNNKELEEIYKTEQKMIDIIFNYYDKEGKWIKK